MTRPQVAERSDQPPGEELLRVARAAAASAARVHVEHAGRVAIADWSEKAASDFVTYVDREAESEVVRTIRAAYPEHPILAEEGTEGTLTLAGGIGGAAARSLLGSGAGASGMLWVIDPLDGTTNYLHRHPMYCASVAVLHRGRPVAGAIRSSPLGREWWAARGGGAWQDGERIGVSSVERLDQALIGTGFPFKALHLLPAYLRQFDAVLRATSGVRRAGSAAIDLCHVASGVFDGFWELVLAPWDVAAGVLLVEEAGGSVTALDGEGDVLTGGSILAGNAAVHRLLGDLLAGAGKEARGEGAGGGGSPSATRG